MESTLNLKRSDLQLAVAIEAGFGMGSDNGDAAWTTRQTVAINLCLNSGLRMVYFPQEVVDERGEVLVTGGYDWSFLKPKSTLTLASGTNTINLPDDFNGFLGESIPSSSDGSSQFSVPIRGESEVERSIAMSPNTSGRPLVCYRLAVKGTSGTASNRSQLKFFPLADADYTLQVWYSILPDALTNAQPYVIGGAAHAETFKAAVVAAYERDFDGGGNGSRMGEFVRRLRGSIATDRRMKPQILAPMTDGSWVDNSFRVIGANPVSYMGITPGVA